MERLVQALFLLCVSLMPVSCWQRDDFVADLGILPELGHLVYEVSKGEGEAVDSAPAEAGE